MLAKFLQASANSENKSNPSGVGLHICFIHVKSSYSLCFTPFSCSCLHCWGDVPSIGLMVEAMWCCWLFRCQEVISNWFHEEQTIKMWVQTLEICPWHARNPSCPFCSFSFNGVMTIKPCAFYPSWYLVPWSAFSIVYFLFKLLYTKEGEKV